MTLIIILSSVFLLLLLLIVSIFAVKIKIRIVVVNSQVEVFIGKIKIKKGNKKAEKQTDKDDGEKFEKNYKSVKQLFNLIAGIFDDKNDNLLYFLKYVKKAFNIKRLDISLDYGFSEPAITGITGGAIWILITNVSAFIGKYINIKEFTNIAVKPCYKEKKFEFKMNFVFTVKLYCLISAYRRFRRLKKTLKGGNNYGTV